MTPAEPNSQGNQDQPALEPAEIIYPPQEGGEVVVRATQVSGWSGPLPAPAIYGSTKRYSPEQLTAS